MGVIFILNLDAIFLLGDMDKTMSESSGSLFSTVLIANRGEIAVRIARTLRQLGIRSIAVYSDTDRDSLHVSAADQAVALVGKTSAETYLRGDLIIEAARTHNAQAIIPGYGFLSENSDFAEQCEAAGICFIGPTPEHMRQLGLKHLAYETAVTAHLPLLPHSGLLTDLDQAQSEAQRIGYPVMLKSTAGGGGMGMARCGDEEQLIDMFSKVQRATTQFGGHDGIYLERYIDDARHVEVQIFGDGHGHVIALNERDCSLQRRNQKIVEETPPPNLSTATRSNLREAAIRLGTLVKYRSAGTVEFIYDRKSNHFYFLEVNCRLQVREKSV